MNESCLSPSTQSFKLILKAFIERKQILPSRLLSDFLVDLLLLKDGDKFLEEGLYEGMVVLGFVVKMIYNFISYVVHKWEIE